MAVVPVGTFVNTSGPSIPFYDADNILPIFCHKNDLNRFENWVRLEDLNRCIGKNSREVFHFLSSADNVNFNYGHIFSSSHCVYFNLNHRVHEGFSLARENGFGSSTANNNYIPTLNGQSQSTHFQQHQPTQQNPLHSYVSNNIYNINMERRTQNPLPHHHQHQPNTDNKCSGYYNVQTDRSYNNTIDPTTSMRPGFTTYTGQTTITPYSFIPPPSSLPSMTPSPSSPEASLTPNNQRKASKALPSCKSKNLVLSFCSYTKDNKCYIKIIRAQKRQTDCFHKIIQRSREKNFRLPAYLASSPWLEYGARELFSIECGDAKRKWDEFFAAHPREFFSTSPVRAANNTTLILLNRQEISEKYNEPNSNKLFRRTLGSERVLQEKAFITVENFVNFIKYHLNGQTFNRHT